jgi:hypothetical protein
MKILKDHDITGFVNFPSHSQVKILNSGKTLVYLVAYGEGESNIKLPLIGNFCGDDVSPSQNILTSQKNIEEIIDEMSNNIDNTKEYYFGNSQYFPVITSILLGWSLYSYGYNDRVNSWCCNFRELTNEGKKLYYSIKKLHNDCELRILTFNNIK